MVMASNYPANHSDAVIQLVTASQDKLKALNTMNTIVSKDQESKMCSAHADTYDAVIIGAGMAGLAAGCKLKERSKNFLILEADTRVGGRAMTDNETLDIPFDHGATWIHSAAINPLMKQVEKTGIKTVPF